MTTTQADKAITVPCETDGCPVYLVVPPDSPVPPDPWWCPRCIELQECQQQEEMARYYGQDSQPTTHEQEQTR